MGLPVLTGCRRNEILELQWDDLNSGSGKMRLRDNKTGTRMTLCPAGRPTARRLRCVQPSRRTPMRSGRGIAWSFMPGARRPIKVVTDLLRIHLRGLYATGGAWTLMSRCMPWHQAHE